MKSLRSKVKTSLYPLFLLMIGITVYIFFSPYFIQNMSQRPLLEKLGYTPQGKLYRSLLGEYKWFMGNILSFRSIIYYGGKTGEITRGDYREVELFNLYRTVETAVLLNPYNEDTYYFAQGAFTWSVGRIDAVNSILKYVMKYRTWDFKIPYFLGFNHAYFLKDYENAAMYFKIAGEMTGSQLFNNLAARYFYEGGDTGLAISYMQFMVKSERDEKRRRVYEVRLEALEAIKLVENYVKIYEEQLRTKPVSIKEMIEVGVMKDIPKDPYGGKFYIDDKGTVRTTSKMAYVKRK